MPAYMPTRLIATTDSAPHTLEVCCGHPMHTASTPPDEPTLVTGVRFPARSAHRLPANSIQSPCIHRANGLLQIAVSTPLRTRNRALPQSIPAEHCRYGPRDFSTVGLNR
jgi:hypothetical protein